MNFRDGWGGWMNLSTLTFFSLSFHFFICIANIEHSSLSSFGRIYLGEWVNNKNKQNRYGNVNIFFYFIPSLVLQRCWNRNIKKKLWRRRNLWKNFYFIFICSREKCTWERKSFDFCRVFLWWNEKSIILVTEMCCWVRMNSMMNIWVLFLAR